MTVLSKRGVLKNGVSWERMGIQPLYVLKVRFKKGKKDPCLTYYHLLSKEKRELWSDVAGDLTSLIENISHQILCTVVLRWGFAYL